MRGKGESGGPATTQRGFGINYLKKGHIPSGYGHFPDPYDKIFGRYLTLWGIV